MTTLLTAIYDQLAEQGLYLKACGMTQDPDAAWNVKTGSDGKRKSTYGYKAHINVVEEGLIKALAYTAGNVHDSKHFKGQ
jgi:IS5 family transposase